MKAISKKDLNKIRYEWDEISHLRHMQITSGIDISYKNIILPCVIELSKNSNYSSVLDVGCGTGILEAKLSLLSDKVVGIDLSPKSIEIARNYCKGLDNVSFENTTVENYATKTNMSRFTLVIANMTLMTCTDLTGVLQAIAKLLTPKGTFVATLAHPCFWPIYWGYDKSKWFKYNEQIIIEAPFKISKQTTNHITTHVHRPMGVYLNIMTDCGLIIDRFIEPMPDEKVRQKYRKKWQFPRFVGIRCTKK
jgi:2-polyprenyl-3-methyl-5-hydroxy-6-metoxy-1,4-benzoquinol methylase